MSYVPGSVKSTLRLLVRGQKDNLIDLMPLYVAAGRKPGTSAIMWANRTGIKPGISIEGNGPNRKVYGSLPLAQEYAHSLDKSIPGGYIGNVRLRAQGWTESLLDRFLHEPDATANNPRFRNGSPMKLFRADRVRKIERSRSFKAALAKSDGRKEGARRAIKTKTAATSEKLILG
jgi:hypothetical protein